MKIVFTYFSVLEKTDILEQFQVSKLMKKLNRLKIKRKSNEIMQKNGNKVSKIHKIHHKIDILFFARFYSSILIISCLTYNFISRFNKQLYKVTLNE
jgi:hypothetical protein